MKRLKLVSMKILSLKEKSGKKIEFSDGFNIVLGDNDTGKSSLLKSIYYTFGADPKMHPKWEAANPITIIKFEYAEKIYTIIRNKNNITTFDDSSNIINHSNNITKDFSPFFSEFFNFKIDLTTRDNRKIQATPAYALMPFYIDQDLSWNENWKSFKNLNQFKNWKSDIVSFHTGIRPSEYYELKNTKDKLNEEKKEFESEQKILESIYEKAVSQFKDMDLNIDMDEFKKEIVRLIEDLNSLKGSIEQTKEELKDNYNQKQILEIQIEITQKALNELDKDYNFCVDKLDHAVDCPTCGAHYENNFEERFSIAKDEDRCLDLLEELKKKQRQVLDKIEKTKEKLYAKTEKTKDIEDLLQTKKEKITFLDFINYKGNQNLMDILTKQLNELKESIKKLLYELEKISKELRKIDSPQKRKQINQLYLNNMNTNLQLLNVHNLSEKDYKKIDCSIKESGSDLPRALLAYYFSILDVVSKNPSQGTFFPIVIDSPKQQEQDKNNEKAILEFIKSEIPSNSQIIMGIVDLNDISFDANQIKLDQKLTLLNKSNYDECLEEFKTLFTKIQDHQKTNLAKF